LLAAWASWWRERPSEEGGEMGLPGDLGQVLVWAAREEGEEEDRPGRRDRSHELVMLL
jgi:hypothetical protein